MLNGPDYRHIVELNWCLVTPTNWEVWNKYDHWNAENVWVFKCFSICFHLMSWFPSKLLPHFLTDHHPIVWMKHSNILWPYTLWQNISSMIESSPHYWGIGDCPELWGKNSDHITNARPGRLNVVNILPVNNFFQATSNQSNIIYSVGLHSDSLNKIRNYSTWQRSFNCKISLKSYKMFLKNLNPIFCLLHTTSTVLPKCKHEYQYKYYWPGSGNAMSIIVGS